MNKKQIISTLILAQLFLAFMAFWGYSSEDRAFMSQALWAIGYVAAAIAGVVVFKESDRAPAMAVRR